MKLNNLLNEYKKYRIEYIKIINNEVGFKNKFKKRLPNILTKSRFVAPFIIVPIAFSNLTLALIATILFALTDAFDGYFARRFNSYSDYGRILDPICDKMFAIGIALPILLINPTFIISTIILEVIISIINLKSSIKGNNPKSTYLGKFKTCVLSLNLVLNYLNIINMPLTILTNLTQIITAVDYHKIDKNKDILKKEIISDKQDNKEFNNDIQRQKNELLELKKSLLYDEIKEKDKQLIKKM